MRTHTATSRSRPPPVLKPRARIGAECALPVVDRAPVSLSAPPRLTAKSTEHVRRDLNEARATFSPHARRSIAWWFIHMVELGLATDAEIARAMSSRHPYSRLQKLYLKTCNRLAAHLNAVVEHHSAGYSKGTAALEVSLAPASQYAPPSLIRYLGGYYQFDVSTLHRMPSPIAGLTYEALNLVSECFVHCLLPHEVWTSEYSGLVEDMRHEYEQLTALSGGDLEACAKLAGEKDFYHFSADVKSLREQLALAREMFDGRPGWMTFDHARTPVARARALRERAQALAARDCSAWIAYVEHVTGAVLARYPRDADRTRFRKRLSKSCLDHEELEVPLCYALWVDSGSAAERYNAECLYDGMSQGGEEAVDGIALDVVASRDLMRMLEDCAIGLGLLLRAEWTNEHFKEPAK